MHRINQMTNHVVQESFSVNAVAGGANADDVVVVSALRTPLTKMGRGGLKDTHADKLMTAVIKAGLKESGLDAADIGDMTVGSTTVDLTQARVAQFEAGMPDVVPIKVTHRACSSGLQAVMDVAGAIRNGQTDVGMALGVESLSTQRKMGKQDHIWTPGVFTDSEYSAINSDSLLPMGITSENVAEKYGITRERQDRMGMLSMNNCENAWNTGLFDREVIDVETTLIDKQTGEEQKVTVSKDDSYREGTTMEGLAKLPPAFKKDGSTTAGNASQLSDGAASVIVAKKEYADANGAPPPPLLGPGPPETVPNLCLAAPAGLQQLGRIVSYAVVGCPPAIMGIGPAVAIPVALEKAGLTVDDVDQFEINEAFASQCAYSADLLNIPEEKLNPKGGAIAIGHPFGMTGNRQVGTLLHELRRTGGKYGIISMCIGSGQGAAAVFEAYPTDTHPDAPNANKVPPDTDATLGQGRSA